jgi:DNA-binding response OmpR family regulator
VTVSARAAPAIRVVVDLERMLIEIDGEPVAAPRKIIQSAAILARDPGRVFDGAEFLAALWGRDAVYETRAFSGYASRLRALGLPLRHVWGVGYALEADATVVERRNGGAPS